jgi:glucose/arabinose dehydrogenase
MALLALLALPACSAASPAGPVSETPASPAPEGAPATCSAGEPAEGTPPLTTVVVASGLSSPVDLTAPRGDTGSVFIVEQPGRVRVLRDGSLLPNPFLDITERVLSGGERGLLGLAFHPEYAENGRLFVNYTNLSGDTHISEFRVSADPDRADPDSERVLLRVGQPFSNHNGGGLAFGNDGTLFIALGDGGSGGDPLGNGQNLATHLGKVLRIDVDVGEPYGVPSDNPFVSTPGALPEIWAYGLRNPWRIAVDRTTGDLYIGDVGQNAVEEIDVGLATRGGGENYGWNVVEGSRCFRPPSGCDPGAFVPPVLEYGHGEGCSVTGGVVYRGCRMPGYQGSYFYGDFCTGFIRSFRLGAGGVTDQRDWTAALGSGIRSLSSFGTDADGEVYILDLSGVVRKIVPTS